MSGKQIILHPCPNPWQHNSWNYILPFVSKVMWRRNFFFLFFSPLHVFLNQLFIHIEKSIFPTAFATPFRQNHISVFLILKQSYLAYSGDSINSLNFAEFMKYELMGKLSSLLQCWPSMRRWTQYFQKECFKEKKSGLLFRK